jgi:hypothetical protein
MGLKNLDEAINDILDSIVKTLKESENLTGVNDIVRGDRHKTKPEVPAIWVFADTATQSHATSLVERWVMPVILCAIIKDDDAESGYKNATQLAAKARSEVLKDRTLGLREFVQDTQSLRFEPSAPWLNQGNLYCSNAVLNVFFNIREI